MSLYQTYITALSHPATPTLFLDLEAFKKNLDWIKYNAGGKKIRLATKSIRSKAIIQKALDYDPIFQGLMTYDLREALWLKGEGFKDILMGYPTVDKYAILELLKDPTEITLMVDRPEHLEILEEQAQAQNKTLNICVDIDLSMDLPGVRFGVYRSWINNLERLQQFLKSLKRCQHLKLTGLMGYEAQIAGVMDKESFLMRNLKKLSLAQLVKRRESFLQEINKEGLKLEFVNGGGTGSLLETRKEPWVTEITVGSGLYAPVLFDHYQDFTLNPALMFTLPIVRNPAQGIYTALGGGYIASGELEIIKQPTPYLPNGMKLLKHEGAGEVQTPFTYNGSEELKIGDAVIFRHAKAGEICERFKEIVLIENGEQIGKVLTYRGEGQSFI